MAFNRKNPYFIDGEKKIMKRCVFLEKSNKPSSFSGGSISFGILLLTNKRLFFLYMGEGNRNKLVLKTLPSVLPVISDHLGLESISTLIDILEKGEELGDMVIEKIREKKDFIEFFDNENSFVIPLERIVNYNKTSSIWEFFGLFARKKNYFTFEIRNNDGTLSNYCVYSQDPKKPFHITKQVSPSLLNKKMKKAMKKAKLV
jgi:hypothetical protein